MPKLFPINSPFQVDWIHGPHDSQKGNVQVRHRYIVLFWFIMRSIDLWHWELHSCVHLAEEQGNYIQLHTNAKGGSPFLIVSGILQRRAPVYQGPNQMMTGSPTWRTYEQMSRWLLYPYEAYDLSAQELPQIRESPLISEDEVTFFYFCASEIQ